MASPNIQKDTWIRNVHPTWNRASNWRTDIPQSVLENLNLKRAVFMLDGKDAIFIDMSELRLALVEAPRRDGGKKIGPFNLDPAKATMNGKRIPMERLNFPNQ